MAVKEALFGGYIATNIIKKGYFLIEGGFDKFGDRLSVVFFLIFPIFFTLLGI